MANNEATKRTGLPCCGCAYRRDIPGDAHSRCVFDWLGFDQVGMVAMFMSPRLTPRTVQWFRFPFNYDPIWGPDGCPQRSETADPAKTGAALAVRGSPVVAAVMLCPTCQGATTVRGLSCRGPGGCPLRTFPCSTCQGPGEITEERARWIAEGRVRIADRQARDLSGREEARRLGISAVRLSDAEHGRLDPRQVWPEAPPVAIDGEIG